MADRPHLVVITGMSGAGRSHAADILEDVGYTVIDNLPPALITDVVGHTDLEEEPQARMAVVVDTRRGLDFAQLERALLSLAATEVRTTVLFLDADDDTLLQRYSELRRPHPVRAGTLAEAIETERKALEDLRAQADIVIDTSDRTVHQLRDLLSEAFSADRPAREMQVAVESFGFKWGPPRELEMLFDVRFLPNPHWVPELREHTGLDAVVRDYVLRSDDAEVFLGEVDELLDFLLPRYVKEGKAYLTIGVGCTGGKHRSVAIAEELARRLQAKDVEVSVRHRDAAR